MLSIGALIVRLLSDFGMESCDRKRTPLTPGATLQLDDESELLSPKEASLYRRGAATITWASIACRPDLAYCASQLGKVQSAPKHVHMRHLKHALAYLSGTRGYGLRYGPTEHGERINAYCDAAWADDKQTRRSTGGYVAYMSGAPISYHSRVLRTVALSTAESELQAATEAAKDLCHLRNVTDGFDASQGNATRLAEDSSAALAIATDVNQSVTSRTRHISARLMWIREQTTESMDEFGRTIYPTLEMYKIGTEDQIADIFTKALPTPAFEKHRDALVKLVDRSITPSEYSQADQDKYMAQFTR